MRIHHLNCATMCPYGAKLINKEGGLFSPARLVCHCLLMETGQGLILVDTGLGLGDIATPKRLGRPFVTITRPRFEPHETAVQQVTRLGFGVEDVRHIVLTHLDIDHAGGLADFPQAQVHVFVKEYEAAMLPRTFIEHRRYVQAQWTHGPQWVKHTLKGEKWFGFDSVQAIHPGLTDVLLIPLHGHTRGHCGVAIRGSAGWLLHCGDAYFYHGEMDLEHPHCTPGLDLFQRYMEADRDARLHNQHRLRRLLRDHGQEVEIFCAHDPGEFSHMESTYV